MDVRERGSVDRAIEDLNRRETAAGGAQQRPLDEKLQVGLDPWKHRSVGMKCASCMWFVMKEGKPGEYAHGGRFIGRCRRHAPTMNGYPVVFTNDWCGDHKLDEQKL